MTGSKLSIFSHPWKITGYWITTRSIPYRGPYWPGPIWASLFQMSEVCNKQFNTWAFPYWPDYHPSTHIWKCPCINLYLQPAQGTVVLTETMIMPEPQARALSVLKSILLSQGQFIYHDNAIYKSNYYFYFIEGNKTF